MPLNALFGLAFAPASPHGLTSRHTTNSQAHSSKGTPSARKPLTDCKHTVSGTISLPSRGTFHLSLTVLVRYRSPGSIQAYRVVPTDSHRISRARCYSGNKNHQQLPLSRTGLSPTTVRRSKRLPLTTTSTACDGSHTHLLPQHHTRNACRLDTHMV